MAVVKADGYGHGLLPAARAAQAGGATWLGTAQQPEAVALRDAGVEGRIFTWLHVPGNDFAAALTRDIDVAASATWALDDIVTAARATGRTARVHLKADTGLGRNGAYGQDFLDLVAAARLHEAEGAVRVVGVWSHFAYADEPDHPTVRRQREVFEEAVRAVEAAGCELEVRHLANSAATLTNASVHYDLVRPGIAVYGLTPVPQLGGPEAYGLTPAMTAHRAAVPGEARPGRPGGVVRPRLRHRRGRRCSGWSPSGMPTASPATPRTSARCRSRASRTSSPDGCAWTSSSSTWAPTRRRGRATRWCCSGPTRRDRPRRGGRTRQGPSAMRS